ncbi:hypothetical protein C8F01DRAFT_690344 [Mycena amicta]|nr:hypothetical protein C8F01DRAFT_690344 [Mycena amicta]
MGRCKMSTAPEPSIIYPAIHAPSLNELKPISSSSPSPHTSHHIRHRPRILSGCRMSCRRLRAGAEQRNAKELAAWAGLYGLNPHLDARSGKSGPPEVARRVNITMDSDAASALLVWDEVLSSSNPLASKRAIPASSSPVCHVTSRHTSLDLVLLGPQCRIRRERIPSSCMDISPRLIRCYTPFKLQESYKAGREGSSPSDTYSRRKLSVARAFMLMRTGSPFSPVRSWLRTAWPWNGRIARLNVRSRQHCPSKIHRAASPSSLMLRVLPTGKLATAEAGDGRVCVIRFVVCGC